MSRQRVVSGCLGLSGRNKNLLLMGTRFLFWSNQNILKLDYSDFLYKSINIIAICIVNLTWVNFMVCELYFNKAI